jgi:aryl-alcohol dehydrogenase-like predicted oxidoreductase
MFVMDSMCDDFEDIEQITKGTVKWGEICGLAIVREDIVQALRELIELGHAKAWDLSQWGSYETAEYQEIPGDEITSLDPRFTRTAEGLAKE